MTVSVPENRNGPFQRLSRAKQRQLRLLRVGEGYVSHGADGADDQSIGARVVVVAVVIGNGGSDGRNGLRKQRHAHEARDDALR